MRINSGIGMPAGVAAGPGPRVDVVVDAIEVTQAIQDLSHSVPWRASEPSPACISA